LNRTAWDEPMPITHSAGERDGSFARERRANADWSRAAIRILVDVARDSALKIDGRTMEPIR
jgi:hypothetical protein